MINHVEKRLEHHRSHVGWRDKQRMRICVLCGMVALLTCVASTQAQIVLQGKPVAQAADAATIEGETQAAEEEEPLHDDSLSPFRFDAIDERTPFDPEVIRGLREIEEFVQREQWPEVVEALQSLIDKPETLLMPTPEGGWRTLREVVADRIATLPPEGLRVYHQYFDAEAERLWEQARQKDDIALCGELAGRFAQTSAGIEAANYIGMRLFDEGDFGGAALWYQRVWEARADLTRDLAWRHRAAFALIQVGEMELAKALFNAADPGPGTFATTPGESALEWLSHAPVVETSSPRLDEWPQWHGTDTHQAAAPAGRPILLRQWHAPSTSRHLLQNELGRLDNEFARHQQVTMPAWPVAAVNGMAITRTFRGIQVVDVASGQLLWETDEPASPERVLTGDIAIGPSDPWAQAVGFAQMQVQSGQADSSMFTTFAYRDLTSGLVGSDGRQLFVLEDNSGQLQQPNPYSPWGLAADEDQFGRDWSTNRLVSYELTTGKRRWTIGGTQNHEVFDPHLAGTYFLGVPVCAGNELYVVAERERTIQLLALNPDTGETLWSCELLSTGSSVAQDVVRRLWACQPSVCGSVIICPTGLGWVMGIDRWQHSIVWAQRYAPRVDGTTRNIYRQAVQQMQPLGRRWFMTPPIVSGHRVLLTPVEIPDEFGIGSDPSLICLDAYTGELEWQQPQGEYVHLAAVVDGLAVLVGPHVVSALSVATGEQLWRTELAEDALPNGRGIVAGDQFLLPISGGRLWSLALADGSIVDQQTSVVAGDRIGNIAIHNGMLLSSTPHGLSAYPLETTLQSWIDERLAADPHDPEAALRMAEMSLVSGDYEQALSLLPAPENWPADSTGDSTTDSLQQRAHVLRRQLLVKLVEEDLAARDAEFAELQSLSQTDVDRIEVLKLEADRAMARAQWSTALDVYQSLLSLAGDRMVLDGPVEIRLDRLVAARMEDLWSSATPEVRDAIDSHLAGVVEAANHSGAVEQARVLQLFGFHPVTFGLMAQRAQDSGDAGRLVEAEHLWNRLREADDDTVAAHATWRYFELLSQFGLYDDVRQLAADVPAHLASVLISDSATLSMQIQSLLETFPEQSVRAEWTLDEPRDWSIQRAGWQNYQQKQTLQLEGDLFPSLAGMEMSLLQNGNRRVQFFDTTTNKRWGTPIAISLSGRNYYSSWPGLRADGHAVYVAFQDVVSCLSYFETQVLWATPTANSDPTQVRRYARGFAPSPLYPPETFTQSGSARNVQSTGGLLADANEYGVLSYGDDELILLDPMTGTVQWRLPGVPSTTSAYLFGRVVYLIDDAQGISFVVRVQDGRRLDSVAYRPTDAAQLAAFERRLGQTDATSQEARPRAGRQIAPPVRRLPAVLPRIADSVDPLRPLDTIDGTPEPTRVVCQWGDGLFAVIADRFVRIDHDAEQLWLSAVEPETGEQAWVLTFPAAARLSLTRESRLFVLSQTDGKGWLVDLTSGEARELAPVEEQLRGNHTSYVVSDSTAIYLIVNHLENAQPSYNNLQSVQVHGTVVCWSRETGEIRWQQKVENQQLVLNSFEETPVLVFTAMQQVQKQVINYMEAHVLLIDKQTGHIGLEDHWASVGGSVNQFVVDAEQHFLELRTYQDRVRMTPVIPAGTGDSSE